MSRKHIQLKSPNRRVAQSVQNCMPTRSIGTIIIIADECGRFYGFGEALKPLLFGIRSGFLTGRKPPEP
ncbi:hypothetical protein, partial [Pseudomonas syringae]|uniref:hypothetical protein n=2 Tax=Pseudomonas syringae TaxID=317 RepID=UPI001955404D